MKCIDCPHVGGSRASCCVDRLVVSSAAGMIMGSTYQGNAWQHRGGIDGAAEIAEFHRDRLRQEGQPEGNRKARRAAMAKGRKAR